MNEFKIVFLSIIIEAFPFLLIGSLVSAVIEHFRGDELIKRLLPKNEFLQCLAAGLFGLIIPVCECTIIPIARKLIQKGISVRTVIIFMLATPIINIIPMAATFYAFGMNTSVMIHRILLGFMIAATIGVFFSDYESGDILKNSPQGTTPANAEAADEKPSFLRIMGRVADSTMKDFLDVAAFMTVGSAIAAFITISLTSKNMLYFQSNPLLSIMSMQALAYSLSLCSHADAFVGAALANKFTFYPVMAFLITSPMIDIKNTIIMLGLFKKGFSLRFILTIIATIFAYMLILDMLKV